jgi:DNA gyrase/topoisomerase IV subunit B
MTDDYRQYIGVIPLKGKIENVYGVKNTEPTNKELQMINNLLRGGMKGDEFRYGHIVIMTD